MRITLRYYTLGGVLLLGIWLAVFWWVGSVVRARALDAARADLERAGAIAATLVPDAAFDDALADSLGEASGLRVTLITADGTVVGDSDVAAERLPEVENHADRPEVAAALEGRGGSARRASATVARALLYVAVPADSGAVRLSLPIDEIESSVVAVRRTLLATLFAALVLLYPLSHLLARRTSQDLKRVGDALSAIASGDATARTGLEGATPIRRLGETIDRMADDLEAGMAERLQARKDLQTLFDGLEEGLAFIDADAVLRFSNPAFERWAGRPMPIGERAGRLFRTPAVLRAIDRARRGESVEEEVVIRDRNVLMSARPHRGGALLVLRDLTQIRRLEGVRRDFVANVSHELKTPLTSIVGFAEAISEGDVPSDAARDFGGRILANATRMRRLVDDLLDLALVESGSWTPTLESVSPGVLALEVWEDLLPDVTRGRTLELDDPAEARVHADAHAVRQILRNLLDNAVRYAPDGSSVRVVVRDDGAFVRTELHDDGPGIPSVHLERVFERFYRVDPGRSREMGGTGLGLAIVKHFVGAHGGEVGIESVVSRGTTVWFTLPVSGESLDVDAESGPQGGEAT